MIFGDNRQFVSVAASVNGLNEELDAGMVMHDVACSSCGSMALWLLQFATTVSVGAENPVHQNWYFCMGLVRIPSP